MSSQKRIPIFKFKKITNIVSENIFLFVYLRCIYVENFSKSTFMIFSFFSCMSYQMALCGSVKCTLTNVQIILSDRYSRILDKLFLMKINVFLRPRQFLFIFKLDPSVLYFLTSFEMVISVGETLSRKRCSKSC